MKTIMNIKLLRTKHHKIIKKGTQWYEFESYAKDPENPGINYLQIKYIGYTSDIRFHTGNTHYNFNATKKKYFYSPLEFFDKILIINLKHRTDRKQEMLHELAKFNLSKNKVIFIDAIYDSIDGARGCTKSHIKCIEYAQTHCLKNVMILEDDYDFTENKATFEELLCKFLVSNVKWDALLFYQSIHGPPVNMKTTVPNVYINLWSQSTAAYVVNSTMYSDFIDMAKQSLKLNRGPIDFHWNTLRNRYNWFVIKGTVGNQRSSFSDIEKKKMNYSSANDHYF